VWRAADDYHGYGNALNVMRAMLELERVGVAALTLEDTLLAAQFGRKSTEPRGYFVWAREYMDVQEPGGVGLWLDAKAPDSF
jgi:hypothetical protein